MRLSRRSILLAGSLVVVGVSPVAGQQTCTPLLSFEDVRFSPVQDLRRKWTAVLRADASRCASAEGRFSVNFIRLKENAPDLPFAYPLAWKQGRTEVAVEFAADEAVLDYSIGEVAPCACPK